MLSIEAMGMSTMNLMLKILLKRAEIWYTCSPILQRKLDSSVNFWLFTGPEFWVGLESNALLHDAIWFLMYRVGLTNFLAMKVYSFIAFLCL